MMAVIEGAGKPRFGLRMLVSSAGGYGHHLIDRDDKISRRLPPDVRQEGNPIARQLNDITERWSARLLVNDQLYLSPEETAFLALDIEVLVVSENKRHLNADELWLRIKDLGGPKFLKRYELYRYLRRNGWCVRSGLPYGCEYMIYRGTPSAYHAAAGVKIEGQIDPHLFVGFNRALAKTRKSLIVMTPLVPEGLDTSEHSCANAVQISMSTSTTMFVDRKMNDMKEKELKMLLKRKA
ncbi:hypothetical protein Q1695_007025 [Nippostrongylus brasiliensis]|nr:hypothetical protein Q1695_007025 [Nippostrongylus brasiliensis]